MLSTYRRHEHKTRLSCLVNGVNRICDKTKDSFNIFCRRQFHLSRLVATSVHAADTDKTRQSCDVRVGDVKLGISAMSGSFTQVYCYYVNC